MAIEEYMHYPFRVHKDTLRSQHMPYICQKDNLSSLHSTEYLESLLSGVSPISFGFLALPFSAMLIKY